MIVPTLPSLFLVTTLITHSPHAPFSNAGHPASSVKEIGGVEEESLLGSGRGEQVGKTRLVARKLFGRHAHEGRIPLDIEGMPHVEDIGAGQCQSSECVVNAGDI